MNPIHQWGIGLIVWLQTALPGCAAQFAIPLSDTMVLSYAF
jgi:hypothetical protein